MIAFLCICVSGIRPPYPIGSIQKVESGMDERSVLQLLGEPDEYRASSWRYDRPGRTGWADIYFDQTGLVERVDVETLWETHWEGKTKER
jgi:outer membrane protein assembly factor BamE (lipoprotein component of BamABCDE complex)